MPDSSHHRADAHRWLRRNRYQEGPNFLFLATQDGRPPNSGPKPSRLAKVRLRMRAVRLANERGLVAAIEVTGCSRASVYRWQRAFEKGGIGARVGRPGHHRHPSPHLLELEANRR